MRQVIPTASFNFLKNGQRGRRVMRLATNSVTCIHPSMQIQLPSSNPYLRLRFCRPMRLLLLSIALSSGVLAYGQVYRFGEPSGVAMWSAENHKPSPDGFSGVKPVVIIEGKEMTVLWGNSKSAGGQDITWKANVIHHDNNSISAVCVDPSMDDSAVMLYTIDLKRGFLYMSSHKDSTFLDGSMASSFVAKLEKK